MKGVVVTLGIAAAVMGAVSAFLLFQAMSMKEFCEGVRAGDGVEALRQRVAASYTYKTTKDFTSNGERSFFVRSDWSMGRVNCLVRYSENKVVFAKYVSD
jgi:hypothetical protein